MMDSRGLYDDDIYAWSEQQAAVLRGMAQAPDRLPNDLDLEHVAEEIEDLGRSERHAAESALRLILVHLIKLAAAPNSQAVRHWRKEIVSFQIELASRLTQSMAHRIDMDQLWRAAKREARAGLEEDEVGEVPTGLWAIVACPLDIQALTDENLEIDRVITRLRSDG